MYEVQWSLGGKFSRFSLLFFDKYTETQSEHHEGEDLGTFDNAAQRIIGPKKDCHPSSTAFESANGRRERDGPRVYSIGCSVQQFRKVIAPNASLKQMRIQAAQERQGRVKDLVTRSPPIWSWWGKSAATRRGSMAWGAPRATYLLPELHPLISYLTSTYSRSPLNLVSFILQITAWLLSWASLAVCITIHWIVRTTSRPCWPRHRFLGRTLPAEWRV